jgi:hypothetical protein
VENICVGDKESKENDGELYCLCNISRVIKWGRMRWTDELTGVGNKCRIAMEIILYCSILLRITY